MADSASLRAEMLRVVAAAVAVFAVSSCKSPSTLASDSEAASAGPEVELVLKGGPAKLEAEGARALQKHVEHALSICNFTSVARPEIFGGADLDALWKERERSAHVRVRYPSVKRVQAVAGELELEEVMLSVGQPHGPEPALIRGKQGVVGLKKCGYDDRLLGCVPELRGHFVKPAACPPGM